MQQVSALGKLSTGKVVQPSSTGRVCHQVGHISHTQWSVVPPTPLSLLVQLPVEEGFCVRSGFYNGLQPGSFL